MESRYQTIQENILYDNIEINRYDLNTAVRVSICVPDDAYKLLQKEISATVNSVSWEPRSPIPEEYLLIYNDFGAFEFAVPENWDRELNRENTWPETHIPARKCTLASA